MKVGTARNRAIEWVMQHASREAGFRGAYFSGSTVGQPDDVELAESSDVDIVIVIEEEEPPLKLGKFVYRDTLVEATYLSIHQLATAKEVLLSYHLAGSFRTDTIIADPTGHLRRLQEEVCHHFTERAWVRRRCENAQQKIENALRTFDASAPFHDKVTSWLFPTGVTTHVILVAALRNPTVRLRYFAAREILSEYDHLGLYSDLLKLLGCAQMTPERVEHHLTELERTFDAAVAVAKTPFFFLVLTLLPKLGRLLSTEAASLFRRATTGKRSFGSSPLLPAVTKSWPPMHLRIYRTHMLRLLRRSYPIWAFLLMKILLAELRTSFNSCQSFGRRQRQF